MLPRRDGRPHRDYRPAMNDLSTCHELSPRGYRLHKLELYNWGTFDSSRGNIHTVRPQGQTTLLIGQNGSGKSTVVDALLTLLVRPVVRNYNVAAGGHKQERDERTYIKGAYGRFSRDDDNHAEVQFLRPDGRHFSALLACFRNDGDDVITLAQVLHLNAEGGTDKLYCFADSERSVAEDCAGLKSTERLRQQMEKRGFRATSSYTEYHGWLTRATGIRAKAMDMFNQTVAVKDIQSLNRFIREHMLEAKPWNDKIDSLHNHFTQLSEAHLSLVRVRRQFELLTPVVERGETYRVRCGDLEKAQRLLDASESFFLCKTIELFEPFCVAKRDELTQLAEAKRRIERDADEAHEEIRQLKNEIDAAGGERLRLIPHLIEKHTTQARDKREKAAQFQQAVRLAGVSVLVIDTASLRQAHDALGALTDEIARKTSAAEQERNETVVERGLANRQIEDDRRELEALGNRQSNLPEDLAEIRRRLCEHLSLTESELPFVAELIAVRAEEREWESSVEMVLRGFALSLLVPQRHYAIASAYVNRTRIQDGRGRGQKLVYLRVGDRGAVSRSGSPIRPQSMLRKLRFRDGHALLPWVRGELEERFDYLCCDTVEEFQAAPGRALTRERHAKFGEVRHEKDDRDRTADPRFFVLGWDNRQKRHHLASQIARVTEELRELDEGVRRLERGLAGLREQRAAIDSVRQVRDYEAIDFALHEREVEALIAEKRALEEQNDAIRVLRQRLAEVEGRQHDLRERRDDIIRTEQRASSDIATGQRLIANAHNSLHMRDRAGELARHRKSFPEFEAVFTDGPLTTTDLHEKQNAFVDSKRAEVEHLRREVEPLKEALCASMNRYLREFPEEQADLEATVDYLDDFHNAFEHIRRDDLPRHEQRFKERLNEKVIQEIGLLNGAFQTERTEIVSKVEMLNQSLKQLQYRPGTYMKLEPRPVRDREIAEFQDSLRECLAGTFEGTLEADEARYMRIERFLARLREEQRWREKVTDVRRWCDFVARELEVGSGAERGYYEDSTGQSGGEKAKLAFTILVAAIAYQYDIDPSRVASDRFHFVVVDEMFSKVDDQYSEYALQLFQKFGLQLLIVAPLDAKARVTEPYVGCYLHVVKNPDSNQSELFSMTAREFEEAVLTTVAAAG